MPEELKNNTEASKGQPSQLGKELSDIVDGNNKVREAETQIIISGTQAYQTAEKGRPELEDPATGIVELHYTNSSGSEITLIGTHHVSDMADPEVQYLGDKLQSISDKSSKVLILESQYGEEGGIPDNPEDAFGEFAYMAAVGKQAGIEVIPGEPDPHDTAKKILVERPGITRDEVALHYGLKTLVGVFRDSPTASLDAVAPYLHHSVGVAGDKSEGGWVEKSTTRDEVVRMSEQEKAIIVKEMPAIVDKLNAEFEKIKPGERLLQLEPDGKLTLLYDLNKPPVLWDPSPEQSGGQPNVITEISRMDMLMRDRHTFELTVHAIKRGKEPIVAVGSSHVSTLKPAFDAAYS
ncbi:hypothetical protein HYX70_04140 [Candidatus Saccharibacteria bacterium]|nr:hypothetical protein [Candidatus Saccharibacteria bacterium]